MCRPVWKEPRDGTWVVEGIKESVQGRLLVFFPGEHHPENHTYRLLDARDGWNYLAVPLLAQD